MPRRRAWPAEFDVGVCRPDQHRVVRDVSGVARAAEVAPEQHDRFPPGVRVAALPGCPGIWVGSIHDRDNAIGPVEPLEIVQKDGPPGALQSGMRLGQVDVVSAGRQSRGEAVIPIPLRGRKERPGQVDLHVRSPSLHASPRTPRRIEHQAPLSPQVHAADPRTGSAPRLDTSTADDSRVQRRRAVVMAAGRPLVPPSGRQRRAAAGMVSAPMLSAGSAPNASGWRYLPFSRPFFGVSTASGFAFA